MLINLIAIRKRCGPESSSTCCPLAPACTYPFWTGGATRSSFATRRVAGRMRKSASYFSNSSIRPSLFDSQRNTTVHEWGCNAVDRGHIFWMSEWGTSLLWQLFLAPNKVIDCPQDLWTLAKFFPLSVAVGWMHIYTVFGFKMNKKALAFLPVTCTGLSPRPPSLRAPCTPSPSVGPVPIRCRMNVAKLVNF